MSSASRRLVGALYGFDAVVRRIPPARWTSPTPCEGWDVADVVAHASRVNAFTARTLLGDDTTDRWVARSGGAVEEEPPAAVWRGSLAVLLEALDVPERLDHTVEVPFGTMTADEFVAVAVFDWLAHTWDAATGAGLPAHLDEALCGHALAALVPLEGFFRGTGRLGPPAACPPGAPASARLLAFLGRDPALGVTA